MKKNLNNYVFPGIDKHSVAQKGLMKREYFAVMALQGLLGTAKTVRDEHMYFFVTTSVDYADALIEELKKRGE